MIMKRFLKTLIGGALGIGALYVVGKVCYEIGKDVAEVERQLEAAKPAPKEESTQTDGPEISGADTDGDEVNTVNEYWDQQKAELHKAFDDAKKEMKEIQERENRSFLNRWKSKLKNAKTFLTVKKAFDKGERGPGILGSLLSNPDGARIEAYVRDGGVQINVTPKAA